MGNVQHIFGNQLGYPHVVCGVCNKDTFHIRTDEEKEGVPVFYSIICQYCGNEAFCDLQPVFGPNDKEKE